MKVNRVQARLAGLILAMGLALVGPGALLAQSPGEDTRSLTLRDVKDRIKENKRHLEEAQKRGKAGDAPGMETALENFERGQAGLDEALKEGRFEGDVYQREEAFERVEKATRKHGEVLGGLLESGKLPEQARSHVEHALEVSQKGRQTALANLERARTQRRDHEASQRRAGYGQPGGYGRSGNIGGPPSGVGAPGGTGGGPAGTPGAGRSAGRGPR